MRLQQHLMKMNQMGKKGSKKQKREKQEIGKKANQMKCRESIEINRTLTIQELYDFMQQHWDKTCYNDFILGRPAAGAFKDYIMLPATTRCVVCVCPRKGKVDLAVMINSQGQMALAGSLALGGYGRMDMIGEMRGITAQANMLYAAYLESLFARANMLAGPQKRKCPVFKQTGADGAFENVLELIKFAPPESRGISNLSFALSILALITFFTGVPGVVLGVAAILVANSVLHNQGFQPKAFTGRFCGIVAVCMSSVFAFIYIVGGIVASLYA